MLQSGLRQRQKAETKIKINTEGKDKGCGADCIASIATLASNAATVSIITSIWFVVNFVKRKTRLKIDKIITRQEKTRQRATREDKKRLFIKRGYSEREKKERDKKKTRRRSTHTLHSLATQPRQRQYKTKITTKTKTKTKTP